ncbi:MAG TPA: MarR family winged helix-turn-helix transcriptional regulator [Chthoniobacterales bacterium]|nr:MarR family winged helix-turn-helix transcriptional regulator [Chthoniobacterales bacterium]
MPDVSGVHLWLIVTKAYQAMAVCAARSFQESGLGDSDFRVLEALLHKGPLPVNAIGPKVFLTPGSISSAVDRLYERGLVSRTESETDRRVRVVDLTPEGRTLIKQTFSAHAKDMEKLAEVLTNGERLQLAKALKKLGKQAAGEAPDRLQRPRAK